jgi:hypothetical protein
MVSTLFTTLTANEEAIISGGTKPAPKPKKDVKKYIKNIITTTKQSNETNILTGDATAVNNTTVTVKDNLLFKSSLTVTVNPTAIADTSVNGVTSTNTVK